MGNYYAIHTSVKLSRDTPKDIKDVFDAMYGVKQVNDPREMQNMIEKAFPIMLNQHELNTAICLQSAYHKSYKHYGLRDGVYYSFSSSKNNPVDLWGALLSRIIGFLDMKHGDILYRWVYENSPDEELLWLDLNNQRIVQSKGHIYEMDYEGMFLADSTHPWEMDRNEFPTIHCTNYLDLVKFKWIRTGPVSYEVSSRGDKRFSAFYAILPSGNTIEYEYQTRVKGYPSIKDGKGRPPLNPNTNTWEEYLNLWRIWANNNMSLMRQLYILAREKNYTLSDMFATTPINQAHALSVVLNELVATGK